MTELIITSSVLILIVVVLRQLLKGKISLRLQYALWAVVLIRLLMPVNFFSSSISIMNALPDSKDDVQISETLPDYSSALLSDNQVTAAVPNVTAPISNSEIIHGVQTQLGPNSTEDDNLQLSTVLLVIWGIGAVVIAISLVASNIAFGRKLRRCRERLPVYDTVSLPVYKAGCISTPCLFGSCIYVTDEAASDEKMLSHVLVHEATHYRHKDHIWSLLRGLCLVLHWYNPLVWLAAVLSRRDAELACDESTIRNIGESGRIEYGSTLISLTVQRGKVGDLFCCATTMTGGKRSIKERIKLIAKKPKTAIWAAVAVVLIIGIAVLCTFSGAKKENGLVEDESEVAARMEAVNGVLFKMPTEHDDIILIDPEGKPDEYSEVLMQVYHRSSYEKMGEMGFSGGWMFTLIRYTVAQYEQFLCSDGSGVSFFARDDEYYYGFRVPTDVQFFNVEDGEEYTEVSKALMTYLKESLIELNELTPYSDGEFFEKEFTYDSEHVYLIYYPYYAYDGTKDVSYLITLSQPAEQGEKGIWCVERWTDGSYDYVIFPGTGDIPSQEIFTVKQEMCNSGEDQWRLDPWEVALNFVKLHFAHEHATLESFSSAQGGSMEYTPETLSELPYYSTEKLINYCLESDGAYTEGGISEVYNRLLREPAETLETIALFGTSQQQTIFSLLSGAGEDAAEVYDAVSTVEKKLSEKAAESCVLLKTYLLQNEWLESQNALPLVNVDMTGDMKNETFYLLLERSEQDVYFALALTDSEQKDTLWLSEHVSSYPGWEGVYFCELDSGKYILNYYAIIQEGYNQYKYELISLEDGESSVAQSNLVSFYTNGESKIDSDALVTFAEEVNELLASSKVLLSTQNGPLNIYSPDSSETYQEEYSDWLYEYPGLFDEKSTLKERIEIFSNFKMELAKQQ